MVMNVAVTFILASCTILALLNQVKNISQILASLILLIGILNLAEQIFNFNLVIDQFMFKHYNIMGHTSPGRMAPNSAFCFILSGIALLMSNCSTKHTTCVVLAGFLGAIVFSLGCLSLSGYLFSNVEQADAWGTLPPMAENTAIGFILLGMSQCAFIWNKCIQNRINIIRFVPIGISFCVLITMFLLALAIDQVQDSYGVEDNLPLITFIIGCILALIFGAIARIGLLAYLSESTINEAFSLLRATFEATADGIVVISADDKIVDCNKKFLQMWRLLREEILLFDKNAFYMALKQQVKNKEEFDLKVAIWERNMEDVVSDQLLLENGFLYEIVAKPQLLNNEIIGRVWSHRDITLQSILEKQLLHQTTHDLLTDLPNKALIFDLINRAIVKASISKSIIAVLTLDLDKFSNVNDMLGLNKGDQLLCLVRDRINKVIAEDVVLGRIGGDRFLLLQTNITDKKYTITLVNKLLRSFNEPFDLYGIKVSLSCCIGATLYPKDGQDTETLLSNSDLALLRAKKDGRGSFQFFIKEMTNLTMLQIETENSLHEALDNEQFFIEYQPIVELRTGKVVSFEALLRWQHPTRGVIPPEEFIPFAEQAGLIGHIGEWVLENASRSLHQLHAAGFSDLIMAINVSASQFKYGFLKQILQNIFKTTGLLAEHIELELTESVLLEGGQEIDDVINELHQMGIKLSLDDFGTGHSSLSYLRRFPIHKLKIDRSFIENALNSENDRQLVSAIISIGRAFNLAIITEGVENEAQLNLLRELGCDYAQGFYFAKPMSFDHCIEYLRQKKY